MKSWHDKFHYEVTPDGELRVVSINTGASRKPTRWEESNYDPSPWCSWCGAKRQQDCHCGPIAENE